MKLSFEAIVIGVSSDGTLASIVNNMCSLSVKEAEGQELLEPGTIYLASANYHLLPQEKIGLFLVEVSIRDSVN
ncbi:MAG: chemotaxis response regulator CheB [Chlamydiales bacterium]|jgi:chemotaxis response regulator CheB